MLGGIGIFLVGVRIYSVDIDSELSDIAFSAFESAFGIKEAGIALAAKLMSPGTRRHFAVQRCGPCCVLLGTRAVSEEVGRYLSLRSDYQDGFLSTDWLSDCADEHEDCKV